MIRPATLSFPSHSQKGSVFSYYGDRDGSTSSKSSSELFVVVYRLDISTLIS